MKLLVVDDDADVLEMVIDVLVDAGCQVAQASTGEDAISQAVKAAPDALVTDLDLGKGMSGLELAAIARLHWPALPVLYISGRPWTIDRPRLKTREAFLSKPFHQRELLGELRALAGGSWAVRRANT